MSSANPTRGRGSVIAGAPPLRPVPCKLASTGRDDGARKGRPRVADGDGLRAEPNRQGVGCHCPGVPQVHPIGVPPGTGAGNRRYNTASNPACARTSRNGALSSESVTSADTTSDWDGCALFDVSVSWAFSLSVDLPQEKHPKAIDSTNSTSSAVSNRFIPALPLLKTAIML